MDVKNTLRKAVSAVADLHRTIKVDFILVLAFTLVTVEFVAIGVLFWRKAGQSTWKSDRQP
jgi:hypothetical protein